MYNINIRTRRAHAAEWCRALLALRRAASSRRSKGAEGPSVEDAMCAQRTRFGGDCSDLCCRFGVRRCGKPISAFRRLTIIGVPHAFR